MAITLLYATVLRLSTWWEFRVTTVAQCITVSAALLDCPPAHSAQVPMTYLMVDKSDLGQSPQIEFYETTIVPVLQVRELVVARARRVARIW